MSIETPQSKNRSYAVVWSDDDVTGPGRLEVVHETLELHGRDRRLSIPLAELTGASIARSNGDRLRGLPALVLTRRTGSRLRIASLEGAGALHELATRLGEAGLPYTAS